MLAQVESCKVFKRLQEQEGNENNDGNFTLPPSVLVLWLRNTHHRLHTQKVFSLKTPSVNTNKFIGLNETVLI